jgi:hypothetical protein
MTPDPRWLEILKASGWQTAAIALAFLLFLLVANWGWLPPLDPWMRQASVFGLLITGLLTVASVMSAVPNTIRGYLARLKAARSAHCEPIPNDCRWGLAKQPDGTVGTQIQCTLFVSNLTDTYLEFLPYVKLVSPKIRGDIISSSVILEGQWGHISAHDVGRANILILAKGRPITRWKRRELPATRELPVTVVMMSHPPSKPNFAMF